MIRLIFSKQILRRFSIFTLTVLMIHYVLASGIFSHDLPSGCPFLWILCCIYFQILNLFSLICLWIGIGSIILSNFEYFLFLMFWEKITLSIIFMCVFYRLFCISFPIFKRSCKLDFKLLRLGYTINAASLLAFFLYDSES